jgi:hypothetical protein
MSIANQNIPIGLKNVTTSFTGFEGRGQLLFSSITLLPATQYGGTRNWNFNITGKVSSEIATSSFDINMDLSDVYPQYNIIFSTLLYGTFQVGNKIFPANKYIQLEYSNISKYIILHITMPCAKKYFPFCINATIGDSATYEISFTPDASGNMTGSGSGTMQSDCTVLSFSYNWTSTDNDYTINIKLTNLVAYTHTTAGAGRDGVCSNKEDSNANYQNKNFTFQYTGDIFYDKENSMYPWTTNVTNCTGSTLNGGQSSGQISVGTAILQGSGCLASYDSNEQDISNGYCWQTSFPGTGNPLYPGGYCFQSTYTASDCS